MKNFLHKLSKYPRLLSFLTLQYIVCLCF